MAQQKPARGGPSSAGRETHRVRIHEIMAVKSKQTDGVVDIIEIARETVSFHLRGRSPFIFNAMSEKARHELLLPRGRKTMAEKASTLKHEPLAEFRASVYRSPAGPTELVFRASGFKKAMASAAVDIPGAARTQIGRLVYVEGDYISIYGVPELFMSVVRSSDIARTPDIRTRAILREWAVRLDITYAVPLMRGAMVSRLLAAAGLIIGVGDWRQEKGSGNYGAFDIVAADDPDYQRIVQTGGRDAQQAGLAAPAAYDSETAELLSWFDTELDARRTRGVA